MKRVSYDLAYIAYENIAIFLDKHNKRYNLTGSMRRKKEDVGDIDLLIEGEKKELLNLIETYSGILKKIDDEGNYLLKSKIKLQIIWEIKEEYDYTLWHSTGTKAHVKKIKELYKKSEKKINKKNFDEKKIYQNIELEYIELENRQG